MSNSKSEYINYQQFEISTSSDFYQNNESKLKNERKKLLKNKLYKILPIFLSFLFFMLFIIILFLYYSKSNEYNELEQKVMDHIFFPYHSDLIPNLKVLKRIKEWIKQVILKKTGIEYKPSLRMYYKATKDGDNHFHEKTDKWEGYILLIKDEKNNIFGGYTSKNFKPNLSLDIYYGSKKEDKTAFLFNLNKNEIYTVIDEHANYHIYGDIDDGPVFGSYSKSDLYIPGNFLSIQSYSKFPKLFNKNGDKNINKNKLSLTNGRKKFKVKELEVFRVNLLP